MILTQSQRHALETIVEMGRISFGPQRALPHLRLRLYPLLAGPTGVGKSFLVAQAAQRLGLNYFKITRGDWMVLGGKGARPTVYQILDRLLADPGRRLLLHVDELDKFQINVGAHDWAASIAADLWNILDGHFQIATYLQETTFQGDEKPPESAVRQCVRDNLWIVGSGTWQDLHQENQRGATLGFSAGSPARPLEVEAIARAGTISVELLHRFNGDLLVLTYPDLEETAVLLKSTGLTQLARELGEQIDPAAVDWNHGGMRALETIATRLVLARSKATRAQTAPEQLLLPGPCGGMWSHQR